MRIVELRCDAATGLHIWSRHRIAVREVEEAAYQHGFVIRGRAQGVYEVYGRTEAGRYLMIAVRYLGAGVGRLITSREMSETERRRYDRHTAH